MNYIILIAALLPAFVMLMHIYRKDKYHKEPAGQLLRGFVWGIASAFMALVVAYPLSELWQDMYLGPTSFIDCAYKAFFCAAIPEECAKALCLYLFLRKNPYFDEYMDGIVYAVAIGMGFAGIENVMYLFGNTEAWIPISITRAIISVPGHYAFAVMMGYFFSLWRMTGRRRNLWLMLMVPIIGHGVFDFILFYMSIETYMVSILTIIFIIFLGQIRNISRELIKRHLTNDKQTMP